MVSSSSTKKAARLAQKGKGKRVRFQGGTLFPVVILLIIVVGLATVVYAKASQPKADASPPTTEDHWHAAYGFLLCDTDSFRQLNGALEEVDSNGNLVSTDFFRTGVHSHDDGVIHWHPYSAAAVGTRAQLGVFLDNYGVELDDDSLRFPENQGGGEYVEGETECPDGKDGELQVVVWDSASDTGNGRRYVSGFNDIHIDHDGMIFTIAFVPEGTDIPMPPWASELAQLGAADQGQTAPTTTVAGAAGSTPAGSTPTTAGSNVPATTVPPTTTG